MSKGRVGDVHVLFGEDPSKPRHPLRIETTESAGGCALKIRYRICRNLFLNHNSLWTYGSQHIF